MILFVDTIFDVPDLTRTLPFSKSITNSPPVARVVAPTDNGAVVNIVIDLDPEIHSTDTAAERLEKDVKPASVWLSTCSARFGLLTSICP